MFTYIAPEKIVMLKVRDGNKTIGEIIKTVGGYCYKPVGSSKTGEIFNTVHEVKLSIEQA